MGIYFTSTGTRTLSPCHVVACVIFSTCEASLEEVATIYHVHICVSFLRDEIKAYQERLRSCQHENSNVQYTFAQISHRSRERPRNPYLI